MKTALFFRLTGRTVRGNVGKLSELDFVRDVIIGELTVQKREQTQQTWVFCAGLIAAVVPNLWNEPCFPL